MAAASAVRQRSAVVIIEKGRLALIRRERDGLVYHLFPGGGVELGETAEHAAAREAREELGLEVEVLRLLADVEFRGNRQVFFAARTTGGAFGTGTGREMSNPPGGSGTYTAVWLAVTQIRDADVRPKALASAIARDRDLRGPWPLRLNED